MGGQLSLPHLIYDWKECLNWYFSPSTIWEMVGKARKILSGGEDFWLDQQNLLIFGSIEICFEQGIKSHPNCRLHGCVRSTYSWIGWDFPISRTGNEGFGRSSVRDPPLLIPHIQLIKEKLTLKKQGEFWCLSGWEWGIRTPDAGFRVRSLTTWRIPKKKKVAGLYRKFCFFQVFIWVFLEMSREMEV